MKKLFEIAVCIACLAFFIAIIADGVRVVVCERKYKSLTKEGIDAIGIDDNGQEFVIKRGDDDFFEVLDGLWRVIETHTVKCEDYKRGECTEAMMFNIYSRGKFAVSVDIALSSIAGKVRVNVADKHKFCVYQTFLAEDANATSIFLDSAKNLRRKS